MAMLLWVLGQLWDWLSWAFREWWRVFVAILQTVWGKILIVIGWVWVVIQIAKFLLNLIVNTFAADFMASFSDTSIPNAVLSTFAVINYVLPLVELITYLVAYGLVLATMALYRHIKSLVPGPVSGGT